MEPARQDPFLGELRAFRGPLPESEFLPCDGRRMSIDDNEPLYSLIKDQFGGDGKTYFNLPDLRGRVTDGIEAGRVGSIGDAGGSEGDGSIPYEVVNWGICVRGIYPRAGR